MKLIKNEIRKVYHLHQSDRLILIVWNAETNDLIGVNFMQGGPEDMELFTKHFSHVDEKLTKFVKEVANYAGTDEFMIFYGCPEARFINEIDELMWLYIRVKEDL